MWKTGKWTTFAAAALLVAATLAVAGRPAAAQADKKAKIVVVGSTTVEPIAASFAEYLMAKRPNLNITVSGVGSSNGAKSLIDGTCDVATMSRFMKPEEFKSAIDKGVIPVAHVVAFDGLAVIVHPSNPVKELTLQQVTDIYAGRVDNWREVGGPDMKIVRVGRDTSSGTFETIQTIVMHKENVSKDVETLGSNGAVQQAVSSTPAAVGYVALGFLDGVKALLIDGVEPTSRAVVTGAYPIARPLFMWTDGYPKLGSPVHRYVTLYLTPEGQDIVEDNDSVPVTDY